MITIVVCSVNLFQFEQFEESVRNSIGTPYELIRIDNSHNDYGICEAYNKGAARAAYPYLCFAHEDILFGAMNWGPPLIAAFNSRHAGIIGIAGSKYKSLAPGVWSNNNAALDCYAIVQHYPLAQRRELQVNNPGADQDYAEVKTLDGVFLFTSGEIWRKNQFDAATFKGFHSYDLDFCLQVGRSYPLYVAYHLMIEHLSPGKLDSSWVEQSILLSEKWKASLPLGNLSFTESRKMEWSKKRHFFLSMLIYNSSLAAALKVFFDFGYFRFFSLKNNLSFAAEICSSFCRKLTRRLRAQPTATKNS